VITVSKELLKAILEAESEGETVISATLAHWLKVSPPAVPCGASAEEDGLVRVNTDGRVADRCRKEDRPQADGSPSSD